MNQVLIDMRQEIRELAHSMVRCESWAKEAAERGRWQRVAEWNTQRELVRARRSALLREVWESRWEN